MYKCSEYINVRHFDIFYDESVKILFVYTHSLRFDNILNEGIGSIPQQTVVQILKNKKTKKTVPQDGGNI